VKKCKEAECTYCSINPPRLSPELFDELFFLPDPLLGPNGEYMTFDEVYSTYTNGEDRPALKSKPQATTSDKSHKHLLVGGKLQILKCIKLEHLENFILNVGERFLYTYKYISIPHQ
jgi:hypothetical protein